LIFVLLAVLFRYFVFISGLTWLAGFELITMTAVLSARRDKYAFLYPLITVGLTNLVIPIGRVTMTYVLAAWLIVGFISFLLRRSPYIVSAIASTSAFFFITNLGVFLEGWYGYSVHGLLNCYWMALPFVYKQMFGNLMVAIIATFGLKYKTIFATLPPNHAIVKKI